jgi:hypothetical protein
MSDLGASGVIVRMEGKEGLRVDLRHIGGEFGLEIEQPGRALILLTLSAAQLREFADLAASAVGRRGPPEERDGCQMCGAHPDTPCDCHDPQGGDRG